VGASGEALSKRLGSLSLEQLRQDGLEPMAVASYLAKIGTSDPVEPRLSLGELAQEFDFVKIGLFADIACRSCIQAAAARTLEAALVGVLFADQAPDLTLLDEMASAGFAGVMLDTADKRNGTLLDAMSEATLCAFVSRSHALGLFAGLAGSLREHDVPSVLRCAPDFVGFRGALCEGHERRGRISRDRARALAAQIERHAGDRASTMNRLGFARTLRATSIDGAPGSASVGVQAAGVPS